MLPNILHIEALPADGVAEWLRRWTANPLCSARVGSNPILIDCTVSAWLAFLFRKYYFLTFTVQSTATQSSK